MNKNLQDDLEIILNYFLNGLKDIEAATGEVQPMMYEVNSALIRVKKLNIDDVSKKPIEEWDMCDNCNTVSKCLKANKCLF